MLTTPVADGTVTTDILRFADLAAVKGQYSDLVGINGLTKFYRTVVVDGRCDQQTNRLQLKLPGTVESWAVTMFIFIILSACWLSAFELPHSTHLSGCERTIKD